MRKFFVSQQKKMKIENFVTTRNKGNYDSRNSKQVIFRTHVSFIHFLDSPENLPKSPRDFLTFFINYFFKRVQQN